MKLILLLTIVCITSATAGGFAQKITLSKKNASLKEIFSEIRKQTGYGFLYTDALLKEAKPVNVSVNDATIRETLDKVFSGQPISYSIDNNTVILQPKVASKTVTDKTGHPPVTITGKVLDDNGNPLPSVSVMLKGTITGTTTNNNGVYTLTAPDDGILIFSIVGFEPQELSINNRTTINVILIRNDEALDQVVVVAYGTVKKGENTSAISQIDYEDIKSRAITNIASALEGSAPGIQSLSASGQPGESPAIRIRGFGSINADQNPIYVVDGAIYDGGLSNFNMEDVESLSVLKDAASTALYGSRGANGVIIITTKKGKRNTNGVSFKINQGFVSRALPEYDRVDVYQYYPLMWEAYKNLLVTSGQTDAEARANASLGIKSQLGYNPFNVADNEIVNEDGTLNPNAQLLWGDDLDWAGEVERLGKRQEYSLGFNGANDKSNYYASLSYVDEKGFLANSDQNRFMGRLNATTQPMKWFKAGVNLSGTLTESKRAGLLGSLQMGNPFFFARNLGPIYPVHLHDPATGDYILDGSGNKIYDLGAALAPGVLRRPGGAFNARHMVMENELDRDAYIRNYTGARSFIEIGFLKDLKFTTNISVDISNTNTSSYGNNIVGESAPAGSASKSDTRTTSYTFNQLLDYSKKIDLHNISVLGGHEVYSRNIRFTSASRTEQIMENNYELTNFAIPGNATSSVDNYRIESYLSRLNYNYDSKYFLSASLRTDGNSRFREDLRWESFYSLGLAWRLDRENFMKGITLFDALKLRGSYGRVGNDAGIGYYPYQALYALGFNNGPEAGIRQSNIGSSDLTWEGQKSIDGAIEFSMFKSRLNGTIEYYSRISDDLIFDVILPLSMGGYTVSKNIGALVNKGWEIQLNGDIVREKNWKWNMGINMTTLTNEVTKMPSDRPEIIQSTNYRKLSVGHSIYDFWLVEGMGVDPASGVPLYRAVNTDPSLTTNVIKGGDTLTTLQSNGRYFYAGSAIPDLFGSITNKLRFKNLELNILLTYQLGGNVLDQPYASLMHNGSYGAAMHTDILKAWKQPGDITDVPRLENGTTNYYTSRYLTDASFLNIRNVSLSYNLPDRWYSKINARSARIYVNGENLHWFSARKGMNVQQSYTGITSNVYVPARTVTVGLNLDF